MANVLAVVFHGPLIVMIQDNVGLG